MEQVKFLKDQLDQEDFGSSMAASWSNYLPASPGDGMMIEPDFAQSDVAMPMDGAQMAMPMGGDQMVFSPVGLRREVMA